MVAAPFDEDQGPKIMDEDEWTDRNFGASSLINVEDDEADGTNTSDDSISDLESESDEECVKKDSVEPLTSAEARILRREWIKRKVQLDSEYENVHKHNR